MNTQFSLAHAVGLAALIAGLALLLSHPATAQEQPPENAAAPVPESAADFAALSVIEQLRQFDRGTLEQQGQAVWGAKKLEPTAELMAALKTAYAKQNRFVHQITLMATLWAHGEPSAWFAEKFLDGKLEGTERVVAGYFLARFPITEPDTAFAAVTDSPSAHPQIVVGFAEIMQQTREKFRRGQGDGPFADWLKFLMDEHYRVFATHLGNMKLPEPWQRDPPAEHPSAWLARVELARLVRSNPQLVRDTLPALDFGSLGGDLWDPKTDVFLLAMGPSVETLLRQYPEFAERPTGPDSPLTAPDSLPSPAPSADFSWVGIALQIALAILGLIVIVGVIAKVLRR